MFGKSPSSAPRTVAYSRLLPESRLKPDLAPQCRMGGPDAEQRRG